MGRGETSSLNRLKCLLSRLNCFPVKRAFVKTSPLGFLPGTSVLAARSWLCGRAVPVGGSQAVPRSCTAGATGAVFADPAKTWDVSCPGPGGCSEMHQPGSSDLQSYSWKCQQLKEHGNTSVGFCPPSVGKSQNLRRVWVGRTLKFVQCHLLP